MIRFKILGIQFSLPLLTLIVPLLAQRLGMKNSLFGVVFALCVHETAHLVAAKLTGVAIEEIRILPFGGSARMENPYRLPLRQILPVAAAGPFANLLLAVCFAASAQWGLMGASTALSLAQPNLVLFLFNLLPALPLDGGRLLFALLRIPLGEKKAFTAGLWSARILAFILFSVALFGGLHKGVWNLSFILSALFVLSCSRDEKSALLKSRAQQLSDLLSNDLDGHPARLYQLDAVTHADKALRLLRPREPGFFMLTHNGKPTGILSAQELLDHLLNGGAPDVELKELLESSFSQTRHAGAQ